MKPSLSRPLALLLSVLLLFTTVPQSWATCGGGGGGGMGGMSSGGAMPTQQVYRVPWRVTKPDDAPIHEGLLLYWFPSSVPEFQKSSLLYSRTLSMYATQCVNLLVSDASTPEGTKLVAGDKLPVAVLADPNGNLVAKAENKDGYLKVEQVEKLLESEVKKRESAVKERLEDAKNKAKGGDNQAAIQEYRTVVEQKCLFPGKAKDAAKALKKLGVSDVTEILDGPIMDHGRGAKIERVLRDGLQAENGAKYVEAERLYFQAHRMDPADPVPMRYLGELYRHHTGEWDKARETFDAILAMQSDPMSRAVALHGLGKMTIHEGEFKKGLALMEQSVATYPLALAYRNLSVYWNSEGDAAKADYYVKKALGLDPNDPYNLVFAAAFMAGNGHGEEALKIARENEALLPASYNLAAVYAQAGQKEKALALLKRHFFQYERYEAVRSKEMMEARVDAVFASLKQDPAFVALTDAADGKLKVQGMSGSGASN